MKRLLLNPESTRRLLLCLLLGGLALPASAEEAPGMTIGVRPPIVEMQIGAAPARGALRVVNFGGTPAQIDKLAKPGRYYIGKSRHIPNPSPGFYVRVGKSGAKSFSVRLTIRDPDTGLVRRKTDLALGPYPAATLADAAESARLAVEKAARGEDPAAEKRARKDMITGTPTVTEALGLYVKWAEREGIRTAHAIRSSILHLLPKNLHGERVGAITRTDVVPRLKAIDVGGSPSVARNTASHVSSFLKFARNKTEWHLADWLENYERPKPVKKRTVVPSVEDVRTTIESARAELTAPWSCLIEFLALTGVLVGEAAGMRWDEISDDNVWVVPADRMKAKQQHAVPLQHNALVVLDRQRQDQVARGIKNSPFVFTTNGHQPVSKLPTKYYRPVMAPEHRPHDFRRAIRTALGNGGFDSDIGERILAHTRQGVEGVYDHSERIDDKARALAWWEGQLSE